LATDETPIHTDELRVRSNLLRFSTRSVRLRSSFHFVFGFRFEFFAALRLCVNSSSLVGSDSLTFAGAHQP
jgi:hypothetical protein